MPTTAPLISVLLPSRGRPTLYRDSVQSLLDNAIHPGHVEIVLRRDICDTEPYAIAGLQTNEIIGESLGYRGLHRYYNEAADHAHGQWMLIWNDDCVMQTRGWDAMLGVLDPKADWLVVMHGHFPVVSRSWHDTTGRISASPHADSFLTEAGKIVDDEFRNARCRPVWSRPLVDNANWWAIHHRADELSDAGSERRKAEVLGPNGTSAEFFSPGMGEEIRRDAALVIERYRRTVEPAA